MEIEYSSLEYYEDIATFQGDECHSVAQVRDPIVGKIKWFWWVIKAYNCACIYDVINDVTSC